MRRIQEIFERIPRKSTRRAGRELGIPQPTVWCVEAPFTVQLSPSFSITLYIVTHTNRPSAFPALPGTWVTNKPSVKMPTPISSRNDKLGAEKKNRIQRLE